MAMLGLVGVIASDISTAAVTVRVAEPEMLTEAAVIVAEPVPVDAASPALLIVETPMSEELHVTVEVMSCEVLSENVPVAVNC